MPPDSTIEMRFKITDDGSVVLDKIGGKLQDTKGHVEGMNRSLSIIKWDSIVNLGERAFRTGEQIYNMAKKAASGINDIKRMAEISGLASDTYQKLAYAAKMSDVEVDSLAKGMKILAGRMDDAAKGKGEVFSLFEGIGISVKNADGKIKSFDNMLEGLADRFKSMPDGVQKVALATELFGRAGENLIPMLNKGSKGLKEFYAEAEKLGVVLDEKLIKKGSELEDQFKRAEAWWGSFFKKIVVWAYEATEAMAKYRSVAGMEWSITKGMRKKEPKTSGDIGRGLEAMAESALPALPDYMGQSVEAAKALTKALEKAAEEEMKLNAFYADDVELLKQAGREVEWRTKALDIMEQLGIKTKGGAGREIAGIEEQFKMLLGQGFSPEELGAAREKLTAQLQEIAKKYQQPSGWMTEEFEEGGIKIHRNVRETGIGADVGEMVRKATEELERMQRAATEIAGPKIMMIDYTPVQNANQAVEELRKKLDDIDNKVITVTIDQKITGEGIEKIEEGLVTRYQNKQSRLGQIVRRDIEGTVYYSNE